MMTIDMTEIRRRIREVLENTDVDHLVTKDNVKDLEDQLVAALAVPLEEPDVQDPEARLVAAAINGDEEARQTLIERADAARARIKEVLRDSGLDPAAEVLEVKISANRSGEGSRAVQAAVDQINAETHREPWEPPTHFWGRAGVLNVETTDGRKITRLPQIVRPVPLTIRDSQDSTKVIGRVEKIWLSDESGLQAILFEGSFAQEARLREDLWAGTYPALSLGNVDFATEQSAVTGREVMVTTSSQLMEIFLGDNPAWSNLFFRTGRAPEFSQPAPFAQVEQG